MPSKLEELQQKFYAKQDVIAEIYEQAKLSDGTYDFKKADVFKNVDTSNGQLVCLEKLKEMSDELEALHTDVKTLEGIEAREQRVRELIEERQQLEDPMVHAIEKYEGDLRVSRKTLGQMISSDWPKEGRHPSRAGIWLEKEYPKFELKTLMTTTAGFGPEVSRIPRVVEFAQRPVQVTDMMPVGTTTQASVQYMEETTSTNAAAETAEGAAMPESALAFTERTVTVRKIATYIPVTDEQLADVAQVQSIIDSRLRFFVNQRFDSQIIVGDGLGVNITGFLNTSGIQTQAKGADPTPDAIYKAMTKVRVTGRAIPSGLIIHPNDWSDIRLLRTADGLYIWGNPSEAGPMRIWGIPVAEADVITENTALVGDFANHSMLFMRQGVEVLAGFINDDFIKGRQAIRVTMRGVLVVFRPVAFATITGI